jgi:hypothetical protein
MVGWVTSYCHAVSQVANQYLTSKVFCPRSVSLKLTLCYDAKRNASSNPTVMLSGFEASHMQGFSLLSQQGLA